MTGVGDLASWLHRRKPRSDAGPVDPVIPAGDGPLVLLCGDAAALPGLTQALRRTRPGLRLGTLGPMAVQRGERPIPAVLPQPPDDIASARRLVAQLDPAAVVLTGIVLSTALPVALIAACEEAGVPITLIAPRLPAEAPAAGRLWRPPRARNLLTRLSRVMVADRAARAEALRLGLAPARIQIAGPAAPPLPVLRCNMREHAALRPVIRSRQLWLAASLPLAEAPAVIAAQAHLLAAHHRALLMVAPARADEAEPIAALAEGAGLTVARREYDEEPSNDIQVLVAEDSSELGIWYRLAPVSFMGGTLRADEGEVTRHPFEPAGLGSAILHGPHVTRNAAEWRQLDAAGGARRVGNDMALRLAVGDLAAPDQAARLARAAWTVATEAAAVARRAADAILSDLPEGAA